MDFDALRRWARFDPERTLARRRDSELPFATDAHVAGGALLLDTCVYIDQMQDRTPRLVDDLVTVRQTNHSTVAVQELLHSVGTLDPRDHRTADAIAAIRTIIQAMPSHRIFAPDPDVLAKAALLSGMLCRLQGYNRDHRLRALSDCTLFLQAQKLGLTMLTGNISDFDFLLQLLPRARVLLYRRERC